MPAAEALPRHPHRRQVLWLYVVHSIAMLVVYQHFGVRKYNQRLSDVCAHLGVYLGASPRVHLARNVSRPSSQVPTTPPYTPYCVDAGTCHCAPGGACEAYLADPTTKDALCCQESDCSCEPLNRYGQKARAARAMSTARDGAFNRADDIRNQVWVPTLEFAAMHAVLLHFTIIPLTMCAISASSRRHLRIPSIADSYTGATPR